MNAENLWLALGNAPDDLILPAETPEKAVRRPRLRLLLAAAILLLLTGITFAAVHYHITWRDIFGTQQSAIGDSEEQPILAVDSHDGMTLTLQSAIGDGRVLYLLWQIECADGTLEEGSMPQLSLDFGEASLDSGKGFYCNTLFQMNDGYKLPGYLAAGWNEKMQSASATLRLQGISVPEKGKAVLQTIDLAAAAQKCQYRDSGIAAKEGTWPRTYYPQYGGLDLPLQDAGGNTTAYLDFICCEDDILYLILRQSREQFMGQMEFPVDGVITADGKVLESVDGCLYHHEDDNTYYFYAYRAEHTALSELKLSRSAEIVQRTTHQGNWQVNFQAEANLTSVTLPCRVQGVTVESSSLSMQITIGGHLETPESLQIFMSGGKEIPLLYFDGDTIVYQTPVETKEIASILWNGTELLGESAPDQLPLEETAKQPWDAKAAESALQALGYCFPVEEGHYNGPNGAGIDIAAPFGSAVYALEDGTVEQAAAHGWNAGRGKCLSLRLADGSLAKYDHLSALAVEEGQQVKRGDVIGAVGSTGNTDNSDYLTLSLWQEETAVDLTGSWEGKGSKG